MKRIRPRALAIGIVSLVFAYINTFKEPNFSQGEYDNQSKVHNMMITQQDQIDTSIIITSNLIPTHPSIAMINETINSLHRHLIGLSLDTPLFLTIDGLPPEKEIDNKKTLHRQGLGRNSPTTRRNLLQGSQNKYLACFQSSMTRHK